METCEYCGKKVKDTASTSELGNYCIDCLLLCKNNCTRAINELKSKGVRPNNRITETREEDISKAFDALFHPET